MKLGIRHMFYYILGGSKKEFLSIPLMFLFNTSSHYGVSEALVGDKSEIGWNKALGILGIITTIEIYVNRYFERIDQELNQMGWFV